MPCSRAGCSRARRGDTKTAKTGPAARAAQKLVEKAAAERRRSRGAFAAMTCPRIGLVPRRADPARASGSDGPVQRSQRHDRARRRVARAGAARRAAVPFAGAAARGTRRIPAVGSRARAREVVEQVTVQSVAARRRADARDLVWQLYEVRSRSGARILRRAVQRWQEPGSAWPAPSVPGAAGLARRQPSPSRAPARSTTIDDGRRGKIDQRDSRVIGNR